MNRNKKSNFLLSFLIVFILISILELKNSFVYAQSFTVTKMRAPKLQVSNYKQIAVGDIVGSTGSQTETSLNLSDDLSSKLFNSDAQEILDRNALEKILSSNYNTKLALGEDKTVALLKKKLNNAVLLTGRIQTQRVSQEEISSKNVVVVNGCYYSYNWKATCEILVQVKIIDVATGKMLYNNPVSKISNYETKATCEHTAKMDPSYVQSETLKEVAAEITKLLVPYKEEINMVFQDGTLLKNPFKKLNTAIVQLQMKNNEEALKILKAYTEDNSLKDKFKAQAFYNYALGLFCANQYQQAADEMKKSIILNSDFNAQQWLTKINEEQSLDKSLVTSSGNKL